MTINLDKFEAWCRLRTSQASAEQYRKIAERFIKKYGENFTIDDVEDFFTELAMQNRKHNTIAKYYYALKKLFEFLKRDDEYARIPPIKFEEVEVDWLPTNKVIKLVDSIEDIRDKAIVATLYALGIRARELIALDRSDFDFKNMQVTVRVQKKRGKVVIVQKKIDDWLKDKIEAYWELRTDRNPAAFVTYRGAKRLSYRRLEEIVTYWTEKILKKKYRSHVVGRHSRGAQLARMGVGVKLRAEFLGVTEKTAERYSHLAPMDLQKIPPPDLAP